MQIGLILLAYVVGSVPWAVFVVRWLRGVDVRTSGSGNVGARNSLRVGGPFAGALVLLLDALKGAASTLFGALVADNSWVMPACAIAVVFGHCVSLFMLPDLFRNSWKGWRVASLRIGGMGLATGLGAMLVLAPVVVLPVVAVGALIVFGFKRPTLAAIAMIMLALLLVWWGGYSTPTLIGVLGMVVVIFIKHLQDIFPPSEELDISL